MVARHSLHQHASQQVCGRRAVSWGSSVHRSACRGASSRRLTHALQCNISLREACDVRATSSCAASLWATTLQPSRNIIGARCAHDKNCMRQ